MKTLQKFLFLLILFSSKTFAIGEYKKDDVLFNWKNSGINLRTSPNAKSDLINILGFGEKCVVIDENLKSNPFSVQEIAPVIKYDSINDNLDFKGFSIKGFWVQVKTKSDEIGYVFDGYLSKLKPDFDFTDAYFDSNFKLIKSKNKKFPNSISDNAYSRQRFYKNGSYIVENGSNYDGHSHYFVPNITIEEGYLLVLKIQPNVLELHKSSGDDATTYRYNNKELSFVTSLEAISITKIIYKGNKGVEILFEGWD